jgi:hypothetical protein
MRSSAVVVAIILSYSASASRGQVWSGHTFNSLLAIFTLRGLLHEWFGAVTDWVYNGILVLFDLIAAVWMIAFLYAIVKVTFLSRLHSGFQTCAFFGRRFASITPSTSSSQS